VPVAVTTASTNNFRTQAVSNDGIKGWSGWRFI
jgi:hypothetical protein